MTPDQLRKLQATLPPEPAPIICGPPERIVRLVAVLPAAIRRRWDALAVVQLAERASQLEDQCDELRSELSRAEQMAEHWYENARALTADAPGLTLDGCLVRVQP